MACHYVTVHRMTGNNTDSADVKLWRQNHYIVEGRPPPNKPPYKPPILPVLSVESPGKYMMVTTNNLNIKYIININNMYLKIQCLTSNICNFLGEMEEEARRWIDEVFAPKYMNLLRLTTQASWNYQINLDDKRALKQLNSYKIRFSKFIKQSWRDHVTKYNFTTFTNQKLKRRFEKLAITQHSLDENETKEFANITSYMRSEYGSAKVCPFDSCNCTLEKEGMNLSPGSSTIISNPMNHSFEDLAYIWKGWRDATGRKIKKSFLKYLSLVNKVALGNNLRDGSELWLNDYTRDDKNFLNNLETLWIQLEPLYKKLHTFVRYRLSTISWGKPNIGLEDPIPAHFLGNMWAQRWSNIASVILPHKKYDTYDTQNIRDIVNNELINQKYNARKMFDLSNNFFVKLGFKSMQMSYVSACDSKDTQKNKECFKDYPLISRPDWNLVCHASSWTIDDSKNHYRIQMCTRVNLQDLYTIHHEMGHTQYFIQYKDLPEEFKDGANPGFHEAIYRCNRPTRPYSRSSTVDRISK